MINDSCDPLDRTPDICPTRQQIFDQICAILPRGRAWQTHRADVPREKSVLQRFWWAVAGVLEWVNNEMCRVIDEYFCDTVRDLSDVAYMEYGVPDDCGLYRDLCTKIRAMPEDHCDYYVEVARQLGYEITCYSPKDRIDCHPCYVPNYQPEMLVNANFTGAVLEYSGLRYPHSWALYNYQNMSSCEVIGSNVIFTSTAHLGGIQQTIAGSLDEPHRRVIRARRLGGDANTQLRVYTGNADEGTWILIVPSGATEGEWFTFDQTVEPTNNNFIISSYVGTGATWEIDFASQKKPVGTMTPVTGFAVGHTAFCNATGSGVLRIDWCAPEDPDELVDNPDFTGGTFDDNGRNVPTDWGLYNEANVALCEVDNDRVRFTATGTTGGILQSPVSTAGTKYRRKIRARRVSGSQNTGLQLWHGVWHPVIAANESPNGEWVTFEYDFVAVATNIIVSQRLAAEETTWEVEYVSQTEVPVEIEKTCDGIMAVGNSAVGCEPVCKKALLPDDLACVLDVIVPAHLAIETVN